jgi:hypothetical protein
MQDLGALAAGQHTVWVVLGQLAHQACPGAVNGLAAASVTFTVAQAAPAPSATGSAGLVPAEASRALFGMLALAGAVVLVAGARALAARERR